MSAYSIEISISSGVGVYGWETHEEEDVWDIELDFVSSDPANSHGMTIEELMAWKYLQAEREKELVSNLIFDLGCSRTQVLNVNLH